MRLGRIDRGHNRNRSELPIRCIEQSNDVVGKNVGVWFRFDSQHEGHAVVKGYRLVMWLALFAFGIKDLEQSVRRKDVVFGRAVHRRYCYACKSPAGHRG